MICGISSGFSHVILARGKCEVLRTPLVVGDGELVAGCRN